METLENLQDLFAVAREEPSKVPRFFETLWDFRSFFKAEAPFFSFLDDIKLWAEQERDKHPEFYGWAMFSCSCFNYLASKFELSNQYGQEARRIFNELNDQDGNALCLAVIGGNYRSFGAVDLAIQTQMEALAQLRKTGAYKAFQLTSCYQLAELYSDTGNYADALLLFDELILLANNVGDAIFLTRAAIGKGNIYLIEKKYDAAYEALQETLQRSEQVGFLMNTARVLFDLGRYYFELNDFDKAIDYCRQSLDIREKGKMTNGAITNLIFLAKVYTVQHKTDEAIVLLFEALKKSEEIKVMAKVAQVHEMLSQLYEKGGNLALSLKHQRLYHQYETAVNQEDAEKRLRNSKLIFEAEQTKKENVIIKAQKVEIEQKNMALQHSIDDLITARNIIIKEKKRSDDLLLNILPSEVAEELKEKGRADARHFQSVTVLFSDFKGFTTVAERLTPQQLVDELHACFKGFDEITTRWGIEKIKTVGDAYLAVCGLPVAQAGHAVSRDFMLRRKEELGDNTFEIRIGLHSGNVVAGIVGVKKFAYDIWGDTVNTAARMEQNSEPGRINISEATYELVKEQFDCTYRGKIEAKNKGALGMYFVA